MTKASRMMLWFPSIHLALIVVSALGFFTSSSSANVLIFLVSVYIFPVVVFRIHNRLCPLRYGFSSLSDGRYSPWWGSHQLQLVFSIIPAFEGVLRVIPGAYSAWLRLWGSSVGCAVYWTPCIEILDRSCLVIGDGVVFGHKVECYGHVIKRKADEVRLFYGSITIGDGVFLGAGTRIGPGVKIDDGACIPLCTDLRINEHRPAAAREPNESRVGE